jgi:protein-L-isoaspartate(D-aspartate) O-methyltransferase
MVRPGSSRPAIFLSSLCSFGAVLILNLIDLSLGSALQQEKEFEERRLRMVQTQIAERDISDLAVLQAMRRAARHQFVPPDLVREAYEDRPLPIGYGQTISQPYIVALMTELLALKKGHKVLEIGTGSGYQAAVLAEIVDSVWTIEIVQPLAKSAEERLWRLGYGKVQVRWADGYYGWPEHAPFDAIIVTAAAEHIPPPLIQQLRDGGRMVIPIGHPFFVQNLVVVEKRAGKITTRSIAPVRFVPLTRQQ